MPQIFRLILLILSLAMSINAFAFEKTKVIPEVNLHTKTTLAKKQDVQAQVTHITRKEIADSPVIHLSELLKQEQSIVRVINNSGDNSQPILSIRGFGDNAVANTLILVDGFPLTNPSLLAPNFNSIVLSDIERVDIIQGSEGPLWGDQAVGGVINIITRHPEKKLLEVESALGSYNKNYLSVLLGNKLNNGFFFKAFGFTHQTNNYRKHNRQTDGTLSAQVGMDYARGTVSIRAQTYSDTFYFPGSLSQAQFDAHPRQATNFTNWNHLTSTIYQVLNKHEINSNWVLETRLAQQTIKSHGFTFFPFTGTEGMNSFSPRLIGKWGQSKMIMGYEGQNSHYQLVNSRTQVRADAKQNNLFSQVVVPLSPQTDITLGGRVASQYNQAQQISGQHIANRDRVIVTEQGLSFHPNNEWRFFIRRDGNFRFPKATEEVWPPAQSAVLRPQTGVSYETGAVWHTERQTAQISLYQLQLHNEIAFDPTETLSQPFGSFKNFDPTIRRGITLTDHFNLTSQITFDTQLNYVNARFAEGPFSGKMVPAVPVWNGNAGISYTLMQHLKTGFDAVYTGSRYASEDERNVGKKLPGYWLNAVAIQYMLKQFAISFEVLNVFNQQYSTYTLYNPVTDTNNYYPGYGRNYLLTLKVNLD